MTLERLDKTWDVDCAFCDNENIADERGWFGIQDNLILTPVCPRCLERLRTLLAEKETNDVA